jgi:hypothetical protein
MSGGGVDPTGLGNMLDDIAKHHGSWAIWPKNADEMAEFRADPVGFMAARNRLLRPEIVFLGLNPARELPLYPLNFHEYNKSGDLTRNDKKLKIVIQDRPSCANLRGGYMTDAFPKVAVNSAKVETSQQKREGAICLFRQQLKELGQSKYFVIGFGRGVWKKFLRRMLWVGPEEVRIVGPGIAYVTGRLEEFKMEVFATPLHYSYCSKDRLERQLAELDARIAHDTGY